jgi:hypothetical protein
MGDREDMTLPIVKKRSEHTTRLITVMEQLAKSIQKTLLFKEHNNKVKNKSRMKRPRINGKLTKVKQYEQKAIVETPGTYSGTPEAWRLQTNKQRYRALNSVQARAYQSSNKNETLSCYKERFIRRGVPYKRKHDPRVRVVRTFKPVEKARLRAYKAHPVNRERERERRKAHRDRLNAIEKGYVTEFLRLNPSIQLKSHLVTDQQMNNMILRLLDSKSSSIVDNLHGFTLREAFVDRKLYASMYIWLARDAGVTKRPGQHFAEAERFLLCDPRPTLINEETGQRYRGNDKNYQDIGLVTIPVASFDTACACSAFETKLQQFFDTRRYGCEKLWKVCGSGRLYQKLRRCDINALEKSGSNTPVFTCGISYINHVRIQGMNAENRITSIRSGQEGQLSRVQQPARWLATYRRNLEMFGGGGVM